MKHRYKSIRRIATKHYKILPEYTTLITFDHKFWKLENSKRWITGSSNFTISTNFGSRFSCSETNQYFWPEISIHLGVDETIRNRQHSEKWINSISLLPFWRLFHYAKLKKAGLKKVWILKYIVIYYNLPISLHLTMILRFSFQRVQYCQVQEWCMCWFWYEGKFEKKNI